EQTFRDELIALTTGEFDVQFTSVPANWSSDGINAALDGAYANPQIDYVLVVGFAANQLLVSRPSFQKPTFLPLVFNPRLVGAPQTDGTSGRKHLNYLADQVPFTEDLASFQRVIPFTRALLVTDALILDVLPQARQLIQREAPDAEYIFVGHDGVDHEPLKDLWEGVDAVLLGGLPRMPEAQLDALLEELARRRLPSFSLVSENEVRRGALAADSIETDMRRIARRNALNMQAVMLGARAADQPVFYDGKRRLTINMQTARKIGLSPRFDVLSSAELINAEVRGAGAELDLAGIARKTVAANLDLQVERRSVEIGEQDVALAQSQLRPQISVSGAYNLRRDAELARGALAPQRSATGAVALSQLLYSESARSARDQQTFLQSGREYAFDARELDLILESTTAYLQLLRARTQVRIQRENVALSKSNLELARDRVDVGFASNADIYRWDSNLATAKSALLASLAVNRRAEDALNRVLNQPPGTLLALATPARDAPFVMKAEQFDELISNPRSFNWFVAWNVEAAIRASPELNQIDAQIAAVERDVVARKRAFRVPDVSVQAQYLDNIDASGLGSGSPADSLNDWNVSLNVSIPLYLGNARKAQLTRSRLTRQQLEFSRAATRQRVEQNVRAAMHNAQASYGNIELSEAGADAARKNLELVSDSYRQGAVSIVDLLDAQNQSLQADLSANNAVHDFLIDIMNFQRAASQYDFLLSPAEQTQKAGRLHEYIQQRQQSLAAPGDR
ncbi:MAG: TolC family protein, partial [Gammaproteobacteria bacterium]